MNGQTPTTVHVPAAVQPAVQAGDPNEQPVVALLRSEFDALKAEQRSRIQARDQFSHLMLTAVFGVATATAAVGRVELALLMPLAALVLGWKYVHNDHMISEIGRYVRDRLGPRLHGLVDDASDLPMFEWETERNGDRWRLSRKWLQLVVDLAAFCVPALGALVVVWAFGPHTPAVLAVSVLEAAALAVLAFQITRYAELGGGAR
ncbi:hypothetical protein [Nonomuraea sp. NPDC005650]|uniref:hypothetical protein n=1 Tax=Nonomuraea sp. NPDC005650 TaxID=3157045 RepID=UPI0033A704BC